MMIGFDDQIFDAAIAYYHAISDVIARGDPVEVERLRTTGIYPVFFDACAGMMETARTIGLVYRSMS